MLQHKKLCINGAAAAAPIAEAGVLHSMLYQQQLLSHINGQMDSSANVLIASLILQQQCVGVKEMPLLVELNFALRKAQVT